MPLSVALFTMFTRHSAARATDLVARGNPHRETLILLSPQGHHLYLVADTGERLAQNPNPLIDAALTWQAVAAVHIVHTAHPGTTQPSASGGDPFPPANVPAPPPAERHAILTTVGTWPAAELRLTRATRIRHRPGQPPHLTDDPDDAHHAAERSGWVDDLLTTCSPTSAPQTSATTHRPPAPPP